MANNPFYEFGSSPPQPRGRDFQEFPAPVADKFSFSVSHMWRSQGNMLRWITDVPSVHREDPLEPAESCGEKHALNQDAPDGHDGGQHRSKRARISSALFGEQDGPPAERRSSRILQSTRSVARTVSDSFQSIIRPASRAQDDLDGSTIAPTPPRYTSPWGPPSGAPTVVNNKRLRFAFVGHSGCGKSSLLLRYYRDTFTQAYVPTRYELFNKTVNVRGKDIDLELWDTSGKIERNQLGLLSYLTWDAVFICFGLDNDRGFTYAQTRWFQNVRMNARRAPIFLVGLKTDLRMGAGTIWENCIPDTHVTISEGVMAAYGMNALKYLECSPKTGQGVNRMFEESVRIIDEIQSPPQAARRQSRGKGLGKLFCF